MMLSVVAREWHTKASRFVLLHILPVVALIS